MTVKQFKQEIAKLGAKLDDYTLVIDLKANDETLLELEITYYLSTGGGQISLVGANRTPEVTELP